MRRQAQHRQQHHEQTATARTASRPPRAGTPEPRPTAARDARQEHEHGRTEEAVAVAQRRQRGTRPGGGVERVGESRDRGEHGEARQATPASTASTGPGRSAPASRPVLVDQRATDATTVVRHESRTTTATVRSPGTTEDFQIPPSERTLATRPAPDSARAANASNWSPGEVDPVTADQRRHEPRQVDHRGEPEDHQRGAGLPRHDHDAERRECADAGRRPATTARVNASHSVTARSPPPSVVAGPDRASTTQGSAAYPTTEPHWPMLSRSRTHGFQTNSTIAAARPSADVVARPGGRHRTPASRSAPSSSAFCTRSPGTTRGEDREHGVAGHEPGRRPVEGEPGVLPRLVRHQDHVAAQREAAVEQATARGRAAPGPSTAPGRARGRAASRSRCGHVPAPCGRPRPDEDGADGEQQAGAG